MRRIVVNLCVLSTTLVLSIGCAVVAQAGQALASVHANQARGGTLTGAVTAYTNGQITIQTPGRAVGVINALTTAANRITAQRLPYVWGGGHRQAGVPSAGVKGGPGFNGRRMGFDCSGAVAAVLTSAGLWPGGQGVPNDWGMIQYLLKHRLITPGAGVGPREVTLYDYPGVHIFMNIDGRVWGTSDGGAGANANGGPGWLNDGAYDVTRHQFRRYHFRSAVLQAKTKAAYSYTFAVGSALRSLPQLGVGTRVSVAYTTSLNGTMVAGALHYNTSPTTTPPPTAPPVTTTVSGTVSAIQSDFSSFVVMSSGGQALTFLVTPGSSVAAQLSTGQVGLGASVTVTYTSSPASSGGSGQVGPPALTAVSVSLAPPPPSGGNPPD